MLGSSSVAERRSTLLRGLGGSATPLKAPRLGTLGRLGKWPVRARSMAAAKGDARLVTDCDLPTMLKPACSLFCNQHTLQ